MMRLFLIWLLVFIPAVTAFSQKERKLVREGVNDYKNEKYPEAEVRFRKALDEKSGLYEAEYDIANSLYKQKKYEEAAMEYDKLIQNNNDPERKANLYHNLGNSQLMAQQYDKGVESYKNALRLRPEDEDTRYNLAYALQKLKEQQEQKQSDQNKDKKDKDQNQNKSDKQQQKDQENKDQENQQSQQNQKDQQQNKQDDKKGDQKKEEQKNAAQKLSEQETEQILNAVQNQEKEVKEKVDKNKAVAKPVRTEKDW